MDCDILELKYGIARINLWNVESFDGNKFMKKNKNSIVFNLNGNAKLKDPTVAGFPELCYGLSGWKESFGKMHKKLIFPVNIYDIINNKMEIYIEYKNIISENIKYNFALDLWIKKEIDGPPANTDYEVMVFMPGSNTLPLGNVIYENTEFKLYNGITYNNVNVFTFFMKVPGAIIDISNLFRSLIDISKDNIINHKLMGIEFGSEFMPVTSENVQFKFEISKLWLNYKKKLKII